METMIETSVSIPTSMGDIADGAMMPVQKSPLILIPKDAVLEGNTWANRAIALSKGQRREWPRLLLELFSMTIEARAQVLKVLKQDHKEELRILKADDDRCIGLDSKAAAKANASQGVYLAQCSTIIKALQAGMSITSTAVFHGMSAEDAEDEEWALETMKDIATMGKIYAHALQFAKGKAGRAADPWMTKLGKWLDKNAPSEDDETATEQYQVFIKMWNDMNKG